MVLPIPSGDYAFEVTLVAARCRCRVMLATKLPSHASNGTAEATWLWHDIGAESCWQQCYQVMMAMVLPRHLGCGAM
jgi:hypothetical protein